MIPKIIHQTCKSPSELTEELKENIAIIKNLNPGWDYRIYYDNDVMEYLSKNLSKEFFDLIKTINPLYGVVYADIFRYLVVYNEGGVYLDIKSTCTKPFDSKIIDTDEFIISQWENKLGEKYQGWGTYLDLFRIPGGEFQQWFIISKPKHPFLKAVLERILSNIKYYNSAYHGVGKIGVLRLSGPIAYTLEIYPMLGSHRARLIRSNEFGLKYSIYEGTKNNNPISSQHYSRLTDSIVLKKSG